MRMLRRDGTRIRTTVAPEATEPTEAIEKAMLWLLPQAHRQRLRAIIEAAPSWMGEEILSVSQAIGEKRAAVWMSED